MSDAYRTDLAIGFSMAIQKQEVGDPLVAASQCDGCLVYDGNAPHQKHSMQLALEGSVGPSSSGAAPRWRIAGCSFPAQSSISEMSAVRNSAEIFEGARTAAAIPAAVSSGSSRGNSPFPTRMPIWSIPISPIDR